MPWGHNHELCFIAVEFEKVRCHPSFYFVETVDKRLKWEIGRRFCADVELGVVGIGVETETMVEDDFA